MADQLADGSLGCDQPVGYLVLQAEALDDHGCQGDQSRLLWRFGFTRGWDGPLIAGRFQRLLDNTCQRADMLVTEVDTPETADFPE